MFLVIYRQYMFLAAVLVGSYVRGSPNLSRPPQLDTTRPDGDYYNSCVDNVANPAIYVVFHDDQCYPEYLIEYNKRDREDPGAATTETRIGAPVKTVRTVTPGVR